MKAKILALSKYLGPVVVVAALGGAAIYAQAGDTVPATSDDATATPTGSQALAFAVCIQADVPEVVISATQELHLWRTARPDDCEGDDPCPRGIMGYTAEQMTGDDDVFTALSLGGATIGGVGCKHARDPETEINTFCIKRGPFTLSDTAKTCIANAARAVTPDLAEVERLSLRRGQPIELEIKRREALTSEEFAICHAAGTCEAGK